MKKNLVIGLVTFMATAFVMGGIINSNNVKHQEEIQAMTEKYDSLAEEFVKAYNGEDYYVSITDNNGVTHVYYSTDGIENQASVNR